MYRMEAATLNLTQGPLLILLLCAACLMRIGIHK